MSARTATPSESATPVTLLARDSDVRATVPVATAGALLAMKLHAIQDRRPAGGLDKRSSDAWDIYRLLLDLDRTGAVRQELAELRQPLRRAVSAALRQMFVQQSRRTAGWLRAGDETMATVSAEELEEHGANRAADILEGLTATDTRELSGIFSTADSVLAAYRSDAALAGTRSPTFEPDAFAASNDTLYLVAPAATQTLMAPLVVALLDQIRSAVYRWRPRPPMLYALDEVANIAPLPDLPSTLAEGGSQGLLVLACLQDLSQARVRWGKAADGFLTLFTHKVLLVGVADPANLKAISALAGHVNVPVKSQTTGWRQSSTSWTTRRQPRLPEDRIASLPAGTALLVSGTAVGRVGV